VTTSETLADPPLAIARDDVDENPPVVSAPVAVPWWRRPMTFEEYRSTRVFPGLSGMRAWAAVIVVIFHFGGPAVRPLQGWVGVQVFFALSGFLITTLALREVARRGRLDFRAFYLRRFFRIVPVYLVVLVIVAFQVLINGSGVADFVDALPYYLTFFNDVAPHAAYVHTWTLGIEQKFYVLWPLLGFWVVTRNRHRLLLAAAAVALLFPWWDIRWLHASSFMVLVLGSLLALVLHDRRSYALMRWLLTPVGAVVVGVGFLIFHWGFTEVLGRLGEARSIPLYGIAVCVVLPTVIGPGPVRWLLSRPLMIFLGERSYSIYLVQFIAGYAVVGMFPGLSEQSPLRALVTVVVSVMFADLLYRWVERPMIAGGKLLVRRGSARTEPPRPDGLPIGGTMAGAGEVRTGPA
jgi:peptidoglycan/LPS O-acetylase OafA/YrhL